jgi:hypothetical protein
MPMLGHPAGSCYLQLPVHGRKRKRSAAFLLSKACSFGQVIAAGRSPLTRSRATATGNDPGAEKVRSDRISEVILGIAVWPGAVLDATNESTCVPAPLLGKSLGTETDTRRSKATVDLCLLVSLLSTDPETDEWIVPMSS